MSIIATLLSSTAIIAAAIYLRVAVGEIISLSAFKLLLFSET